jgi:glycosyltransferase involved in cell wall biosynthesis
VIFAKKKILYLSIGGRSNLFEKNGPSEFFFGGKEFIQDGHLFEIMELDSSDYKLRVNYFIRAINIFASKFFGFPFGYFWVMASQKKIISEFNNFDQIIVTTARLGLPLMLLKKIGKINPNIVYITMGLINRETNVIKILLYRLLVSKNVNLSALSRSEASFVENRLNEPVEFIPFGVDIDFWRPNNKLNFSSNYVFSMGNDSRRDFSLLIDVWRSNYPKLIIITSLPISSSKENIEIKKGSWKGQEFSDNQLKEFYKGAKFVIVPSIETQQPSGQSVTLQAMSCGKAVIYPDIEGIWDNKIMTDNDNILLYKPEDSISFSRKIEFALSNENNLKRIGLSARKTVEKYYSARIMANKIFQSGLNSK